MSGDLTDLIAAELQHPVAPGVRAAADDIVRRLGAPVAAVLFYGSCLRTGDLADKVLDFYVLVDGYRALWGWRPLALMNRLLPPNVFYAETTDADGVVLRSKYAVLSLDHFERLTRAFNPSVWARFAQPSRLVFARDKDVAQRVEDAVADAMATAVRAALPLLPSRPDAATLWSRLFSETYGAELRSERRGKGAEIYLTNAQWFDAAQPYFDLTTNRRRWVCVAMWRMRRSQGKFLSAARLIKASFTFDGGIDYLAWKIGRHAGVKIEITPWQRRHPLLAGLVLFWRLRRRGAFS